MQCFNIPGPFDHFELNKLLIETYHDNKEIFRDGVKISSVFGNFPFCIWDGGRNFLRYKQCTREEVQRINNFYKSNGIAVRLIFTNPEITEEHLHNRYCNMLLKECQSNNCEVVVNSPVLEKYIRENYPKYKIISSTTKRITSSEKFKDELMNHDYFQTCLDYDLNKNKELIDSIPKEAREKCEFLINAICPPHCPLRKNHYSQTGLYHLSYCRERYEVANCGIQYGSLHPTVLGKGNNFTVEELKKYEQMGYKYFKIEGRTLPSADILCMYCYYLIKPEWQYNFICEAARTPGIFYNDNNSPIMMDTWTPRVYSMIDELDI